MSGLSQSGYFVHLCCRIFEMYNIVDSGKAGNAFYPVKYGA